MVAFKYIFSHSFSSKWLQYFLLSGISVAGTMDGSSSSDQNAQSSKDKNAESNSKVCPHMCRCIFFVITLLNKMNDSNLWGVAVVLLLLRRIEF